MVFLLPRFTDSVLRRASRRALPSSSSLVSSNSSCMLPTVFGKHLKIVDGDLWKAGRHICAHSAICTRSHAVMHLAASRYTTEQCVCLEGDSQHQASPSAILHLIPHQLSFACMCYMLQRMEAFTTVTWLAERRDLNWELCCLCLCPSQEV